MTALLAMQMGLRKKQSSQEYNHSPTMLLVALFGGAFAFIAVENICDDATDAGWQQMNRLSARHVHMGSAHAEIITFFVFLFILEFRETRSRIGFWRSRAPWLPLVGVMALATIIHIPICVVVLADASYAVSGYCRTCSVRHSPKSRKVKEAAQSVWGDVDELFKLSSARLGFTRRHIQETFLHDLHQG